MKRRREYPLHVMLDEHEVKVIDQACKDHRLTKRELVSRLLAKLETEGL